jgi:predicted ATPase
MIKTVKFTNFKSLSSDTITLGNFNVLIGANAAGKSNFVDALKFVKDINDTSLYSAIGNRLGWENTLRRGLALNTPISAEISYDFKKNPLKFKVGSWSYNLNIVKHSMEFSNTGKRLLVKTEKFESLSSHRDQVFEESFARVGGNVKINTPYIHKRKIITYKIPLQFQAELFLEQYYLMTPDILAEQINMWRFYHLDVQVARQSCIDTGQDFLQSDSHNLAIILNKMSKSNKADIQKVYNRILSLMSILVPKFSKWKPERLVDGSVTFGIYEDGIAKPLLPAMISDGTIRLLSMLVSLLYAPDRSSIICIDEPERYLHPQVFGPLIEIMREVSNKTQLIITTHSPEIVRRLKPSEVLLVDKINNSTHLVNASDTVMIDKFLEEFSLDELWLTGYLKGGKAL